MESSGTNGRIFSDRGTHTATLAKVSLSDNVEITTEKNEGNETYKVDSTYNVQTKSDNNPDIGTTHIIMYNLLPYGVKYKNMVSTTFENGVVKEPIIIENFNENGDTLLKWEFLDTKIYQQSTENEEIYHVVYDIEIDYYIYLMMVN